MSGTEIRFWCPKCCKDDKKLRVKAQIMEINFDATGKMFFDLVCDVCGLKPKVEQKSGLQQLNAFKPREFKVA